MSDSLILGVKWREKPYSVIVQAACWIFPSILLLKWSYRKMERIYSENPYTHHLDGTINIFAVFALLHIHTALSDWFLKYLCCHSF